MLASCILSAAVCVANGRQSRMSCVSFALAPTVSDHADTTVISQSDVEPLQPSTSANQFTGPPSSLPPPSLQEIMMGLVSAIVWAAPPPRLTLRAAPVSHTSSGRTTFTA